MRPGGKPRKVAHSLGGGSSRIFVLLGELRGVLFVFLADFVELPHVLKEVGTSLERNEKLCLFAVTSVV